MPPTCIAREVSEETGLLTRPEEWVRIGLMRGPEWEVEVYALMYSGSPSEVRTMTDEEIAWYPVDQLPEEALTNIPWMVALAKDKLQNEEIEDFLVSYGEKRTALRS